MNKFGTYIFHLHRWSKKASLQYFSALIVLLNHMNEIEPPTQLAKEQDNKEVFIEFDPCATLTDYSSKK